MALDRLMHAHVHTHVHTCTHTHTHTHTDLLPQSNLGRAPQRMCRSVPGHSPSRTRDVCVVNQIPAFSQAQVVLYARGLMTWTLSENVHSIHACTAFVPCMAAPPGSMWVMGCACCSVTIRGLAISRRESTSRSAKKKVSKYH